MKKVEINNLKQTESFLQDRVSDLDKQKAEIEDEIGRLETMIDELNGLIILYETQQRGKKKTSPRLTLKDLVFEIMKLMPDDARWKVSVIKNKCLQEQKKRKRKGIGVTRALISVSSIGTSLTQLKREGLLVHYQDEQTWSLA